MMMTDIISLGCVDGELLLEPLPDGRTRLTAKAFRPDFFISRHVFETSYPKELIKQILEIKGLGYAVDEIAREQDPRYVQFDIESGLLSYRDRDWFRGKRLLDFGCGAGASTMVMHRMLPLGEICGVELSPDLLSIARARARHFGFPEENLMLSPHPEEIPADLGMFDAIVMTAVFEHLLPAERRHILPILWRSLAPGGCLFLGGTPYRFTPVETHTTGLPLINYLPDAVTHRVACRFSKRLGKDETWRNLLRRGVRGGTESEIMGILSSTGQGNPQLLCPILPGIKDRVDLWLYCSQSARLPALKKAMYFTYKVIKATTGVVAVPTLTLAIRKNA